MDRESDISKGCSVERPALEPPKFSLASLLWGVAVLAGLLGLMTAVGPLGGFALLLLALVIVAHVAGNSLGTRLRSFGSKKIKEAEAHRALADLDELRQAAAPASNLSWHSRISRTMLVFTIAGAAILGSAGGTILIWLAWSQLNIATAIVAIVSPTVLGGWIGFALSSFTQTAGGAWREASGSYRRENYITHSIINQPGEPFPAPLKPPHAQSPDRG